MQISEIIKDSLVYPLNNVKALIIYMIIGMVIGILGAASFYGLISQLTSNNVVTAGGFGIIGILIMIFGALLVAGYGLLIVKYGIERRDDAPTLDIVKQLSNAIKLIIVSIVYYIVPAIIAWLFYTLLGKGILTVIFVAIMYIIFAFAQFMGVCRLAKYDSLGEAISISKAIEDVAKVGMIKIFITIVAVFIIGLIILLIFIAVFNYHQIIGGLLLGIFGVYSVFFTNRAIGLLYSEV